MNIQAPSIISKTSSIYITSTGGAFSLTYTVVPKGSTLNNTNTCENQAVTVPIGNSIYMSSPNYPKPYNDSLDCSWLVASSKPEYHVEMKFSTVELEDLIPCVDFIEVSQSNDLSVWTNTSQFCKKEPDSNLRFIGNPYLKLRFKSDSDINKKGFSAEVSSICGSHMFGSYGYINLTAMFKDSSRYLFDCTWFLNVQYGRRIQLNFTDMQFDNNVNCMSYILLKNGVSENSPNLGIGRLCTNEHFSNIPYSSSHSVTLRLRATRNNLKQAIISFTEIMSDCSKTIQLLGDEQIEIATPNWPNIPNPKTECVWNIVAPRHRTISLDFQGHFNLGPSCDKEYVDLKDGATDRARSLGRLCYNDHVNTIYTRGNRLRIVYFNDVFEPKPGFSAQVKLALCGGTFGGASGVIDFPETHDAWSFTSDNLTCEYFINPVLYNTLNVSIDLSEFGDSLDFDCENNRIEIYTADDNGMYQNHSTPKVCWNSGTPMNFLFGSQAKLKVILFKKSRHENKFKLTYTNIDGCQQEIIASEGSLRTPGYPMYNKPVLSCFYKIRVPKGKRIKLDILDYNLPGMTFKRVAVYNDWNRRAVSRILSNETEVGSIYSTDNLMGITVFILNRDLVTFRGIKMKFSSEDESEWCKMNDRNEGSLKQNITALGNQSYYCEFELDLEENNTLALKILNLDIVSESRFIQDLYQGKMACDERFLTDVPFYFINDEKITGFCNYVNETKSYRLIGNTVLKAQKQRVFTKLTSFNVNYKKHACGGVFNLGK